MKFRRKNGVRQLIQDHFKPIPLDRLSLTERRFPHRVRADLQRAVETILKARMKVLGSYGLFKHFDQQGFEFSELLIEGSSYPAQTVPPLYEEVDIGEDRPVRCLKNGLWLLESDGTKLAVLLERYAPYGQIQGMRFQLAAPNDPAGAKVAQLFFDRLEEAVRQAGSYRGKVFLLEVMEMYTGESSGITVHRLKPVERDQVILPTRTLELLERNVIRFVELRPKLGRLGLATKKGLLFYGPPGTGKTHTIHYLAGTLPGHTTLLIAGAGGLLTSKADASQAPGAEYRPDRGRGPYCEGPHHHEQPVRGSLAQQAPQRDGRLAAGLGHPVHFDDEPAGGTGGGIGVEAGSCGPSDRVPTAG